MMEWQIIYFWKHLRCFPKYLFLIDIIVTFSEAMLNLENMQNFINDNQVMVC